MPPRRGQRLAIQLAIGGQGEGIQPDKGRRQHVVGQPALEVLAQLTGRQGRRLLSGPAGHEIGDQALVAGSVLARHHDC